MNISKETTTILKNFASINQNLIINPGSKLCTISTGKNIIAEAVIKGETFPIDFGIYDLNEFLGVLSLFDKPTLSFTEKYVTITQDKNKVKYFAASLSVLTPQQTIKSFPTPDIEFDISANIIHHIHKVSSILKVTDFSFIGDGQNIQICIGDKKNVTGNSFISDLGTTNKTFSTNFKVENLKLIGGDYKVSIVANKIAKFECKDTSHAEYRVYVAPEADSTLFT